MERLIGIDEIESGQSQSVFVDDYPALVARIDDQFYVVEDVCTHDGQPLAGGEICDGQIACPRHGAKFDLKTGEAKSMPATQSIKAFHVEVRDGAVWASAAAPVVSAAPTAGASEVAQAAGSVPAKSESDTSVDTSDSDSEESSEECNVAGVTSDSQFIEALKQVIDPELMINIVDLGLVYSVDYDESVPDQVSIEMTLTSPSCPAGPQIVQQAKMALERLEDIKEAKINMVMMPQWTPERMTDDARDELGIF
ncbi:MAG: iron-sulfur cluster assembly protein [Fuerstiella sp.]